MSFLFFKNKVHFLEFWFSIFLFSGFIKSILFYYDVNLPIDLTVLSMLFVMLILIFNLNSITFFLSKNNFFIVLLFLIFSSFVFISFFYSPSANYKIQKVIQFSTVFIAFLFPFFYNKFNWRQIIRFSIFLNVFINIWYFYVDINSVNLVYDSNQYIVYKRFYLGAASLSGLSFLLLLTTKVSFVKHSFYFKVFFFLSLFLLRGRGPLIFSLLLLLLYFINSFLRQSSFSFYLLKNYLKIILFLGIVSIFFYDKLGYMFAKSMNRLLLITNGLSESKNMGESVNHRMVNINDSISLISDNIVNFIFGYGLGSYSLLTNGIDKKDYPHNIILEMWVEMGLISVICFLFFYTSVFFKSLKSKTISVFIVSYIFLNLMKSNSFVDIRVFIFYISILLISINIKEAK